MLGRPGDEGGVNAWTQLLTSGQLGGANFVKEFMLSDEFAGRGLSNADKVTILYKTMLGRDPDDGGRAYFESRLEAGTSLEALIAEFSNSEEFAGICEQYGILPVINPMITVNGVVYEQISPSTARVVAYNGTSTFLTIPQIVEGTNLTVVEIGASAFENNNALQSIDLPDTVTLIATRAFAGCTALSTMT